ncbi:restriction endonuclease subunit S [Treponema sp. UBA753]|uniref:restriction endonuclease subunit S n=1 Tax=Treponema sp. UBA753 TaxID=1947747 RepID=UPI0025D286BE|nr:restriction endonuclease subunit S [Treponema sp. UBA753]
MKSATQNSLPNGKNLLKLTQRQKKPAPVAASKIDESEIPFEIPENWCWCRLSDFCNLYTGNSINETEKKTKYTNLKDGRFYIGTKDVGFDNVINYDNGIKIPFDNDKFRIANANSILMCIEGGSAGRKIAFTDKAVCFGNKLCCFDAYVKETIHFLYYFMQSALFTDLFKDNMNGIIGGVSVNTLKTMLIPLPPLAEQKRIVAKVEELLPLCEKLGR